MIPDAEENLRPYQLFARRHGIRHHPEVGRVQEAVEEARRLAATPFDEPAALLWTLVPRATSAFPFLHAAAPWQFVDWHADRIGLRLDATDRERRQLHWRIARGEVAFDELRSWCASRLVPPVPRT